MLSRNLLKQILSVILVLGTTSFAGVVYSQDSSKTGNTADRKIRNIDGVAAVVKEAIRAAAGGEP